MRVARSFIVFILIFFTCNQFVSACSIVLVGTDASIDGSQIIARNEDQQAMQSKIFLIHPAVSQKGRIFTSNKNQFSLPLPDHAYRYTSFANGDSVKKTAFALTWGAAGFNEKGVAMTATQTIFANAKALANDPYVKTTGITEDVIVDTVLPYVDSAKQGVERLGQMIEDKGTGEGFGVAFMDDQEIWYLETGSAHQWIAQRLPSDSYFVGANQSRLQDYNAKDKQHYLGSKNLVQYAIKNNLYDPNSGERFNFEKAYGRADHNYDRYYNYPRVYLLQMLFSPKVQHSLEKPLQYAVFQQPDEKISLADVKEALRITYDSLGMKSGLYYKKLSLRPISLFNTEESHILQTRPNEPDELRHIEYLAYGMPSISMYIPVYANGIENNSVPKSFKTPATDRADELSAQWKFRKLQSLVIINYHQYAPIVIERYKKEEMALANKQKQMEEKYKKIYQTDPQQAHEILNQFQRQAFNQALKTTEDLTNQIMTMLTQDMSNAYKFINV